ncbi:TcdA/TcdB pore-forming domain-containing protein [Vibrio penaeicida]|uniref:TcdA/TcdB pore-forming domain-containing protein n=1 Tax=Vibrio penaeicida TaxID=104609 RepID=UPI00142D8632|nr:TcdA/TcdB pore-forming domain-containing protein [Vibrio penaeicida]
MQKKFLTVLISSLLGAQIVSLPDVYAMPLPVAASDTTEAITSFTRSPREFLNQHTVDVIELVKNGGLPTQGNVRLEPATGGFKLRYSESTGADTTSAYFLGFNGRSNPVPAYVDIPKNATEGTLMLTGSLTGCSVVVTELNDTHYRVFHDGRVGSSVLYDNVVMSVDYADYEGKKSTEQIAGAYLIVKDGEWQLMLQKQKQILDDKGNFTWVKRTGKEGEAVIQRPQVPDDQARIHTFNQERINAQNHLIQDAKRLGIKVTRVPQDGAYTKDSTVKVDENPALTEWEAFRNQLREEVKKELAPAIQQKDALFAQLRGATGTQKQEIEKKLELINTTKAYYEEEFLGSIEKSVDTDRLWIWLEKKKLEGIDAIVGIDVNLKTNPNQRLIEKFNTQKRVFENLKGQRGERYQFGVANHTTVELPVPIGDMTSLNMIDLLLDDTQPLDLRQKGALVKHIENKFRDETRNIALNQAAKVSEYMTASGAKVTQLLPQDFVLSCGPGRCLPLSRIMSTAIAQNGEMGARDFSSSLYDSAASAGSSSANTVYQTIGALHANTDARYAENDIGRLNIRAITDNLAATPLTDGGSKFMLMNTARHSMLVGKQMSEGRDRYFFYDPNFAVFNFDSPKAMRNALRAHLLKHKFARYYQAMGIEKNPEFEMRVIDTDQMARVRLATGFDVQDLALPSKRAANISASNNAARLAYTSDAVSADLKLQSALSVLEGANLAQGFLEAADDLYRTNNLSHDWVPVFENMKRTQDGNYAIPLVHAEDNLTRELITPDDRIWKFKQHFEESLGRLKENYRYSEGELIRRANISDVEHVDGLNAAFAVQTILTWFNNHSRTAAANDSLPNGLSKALKVHTYINLTQIAHGTVMDAAKLVSLYRTALQEGQSVTKSTLSAVSHVANTAVGIGLGLASVVLDSYELAHAQNEVQKAVFGTQLAFDSASLVTSAVGIGAGIAGASTASAVIGGAGVILGGLGIGFTALAQGFGEVAQKAQGVGQYFALVDTAYREGGYAHVNKTLGDGASYQLLQPKDGAVIAQLDLESKQITFDSQYIYRTHHGSTGSGAINYFFWIGDQPRIVRKEDQAINVREGIGYGNHATLTSTEGALVLPATPKSYIGYSTYTALPGATTRHDAGFDVIRRLEVDGRFDFDFYAFPSEFILTRITQKYVNTDVTINLGAQNRQILMRKLGKELKGKLNYVLKGKGGEYRVNLQPGATLSLEVEPQTQAGTRWILDARQLPASDIQVASDHLTVGGIRVNLRSADLGQILVIGNREEVSTIDRANTKAVLSSENASQWANADQLHQHIQSEVDKHHLESDFVAVENFTPQGQQQAVGQAFYQVDKKRFVYTPAPAHADFLAQAQLVAINGDLAWFNKGSEVWLVDVNQSTILAQYRAFGWDHAQGATTSRVWQENQRLYWAVEQSTQSGQKATWTYVLDERTLQLVDINGDTETITTLTSGGLGNDIPTGQLFKTQNTGVGGQVDLGANQWIDATLGEVISISATHQDQNHRFWALEEQAGKRGVVKANVTSHPKDLILALVENQGKASESYYFYSHDQKTVYHQTGRNEAATVLSLPSSVGGVEKVANDKAHLFAFAKDNTLWLADKKPLLAGVTEEWVKANRTQLLARLHDISDTHDAKLSQLVILGAKERDINNTLQATSIWYDTQSARLIQAGRNLAGKSLTLLGLTADQKHAWIFNQDDASLYRQAVLEHDGMLNEELVVQVQAPDADLFPTMEGNILKVRQQGESIEITTKDGVIVELSANATRGDKPILRGVTEQWQQAHQNIPAGIQAMSGIYEQPQPVRLLGLEASWYLPSEGQLITAPNLDTSHVLNYLGQGKRGNHYIYDSDAQSLYSSAPNAIIDSLKSLGQYATAVTESGHSLVLQGAKGTTSGELPQITGIHNVVWSGSAENYHYRIDQDALGHYEEIVIVPRGNNGKLDLPFANATRVILQRRGDALALYDPQSNTGILIQNADQAAQRNMSIGGKRLEGILNQVDQLSGQVGYVVSYSDVVTSNTP